MVRQVRLLDGSFPAQASATLAGDNLGRGPRFFEWNRDLPEGDITFFTDICLEQAINDKSQFKVAWLIEPAEISTKHYEFALENEHLFNAILTWDKDYIDSPDHLLRDGKWLFYPFGGSWIADWGIKPKSKLCSIIVSDKNRTEGHQLRHRIVELFGDDIDVYGTGYNPIESKSEALNDYAYSIVVESVRRDWWFTEKLIDCFSVGTIPIYWGCPNIDVFFHNGGVIPFSHVSDIELDRLSKGDRSFAIKDNLKRARRYACVEDWLFREYPFLFGM